MPVPVPGTDPAPRRLLRDIVFDKMLVAIGDGTLELGERLNDDELVTWLGVSRTPVREAIAKLADYGLVDIEANRYTRVVSPTFDEAVDTVVTATELWAVVVRRAIPVLTDAQRKEFGRLVTDVQKSVDAKEDEYPLKLVALTTYLAEASGSSSLVRLDETLASRAALIIRRAAGAMVWKNGAAIPLALKKAVDAKDADAGYRVFDDNRGFVQEWAARVKELEVFKS